MSAARALGEVGAGDSAVIVGLISLSTDPNPFVRLEVAQALPKVALGNGQEAALATLGSMLRLDLDPAVRQAAQRGFLSSMPLSELC